MKSNNCPFLIPNSDLLIYFDRESKDFDQIVKSVNIVNFNNNNMFENNYCCQD